MGSRSVSPEKSEMAESGVSGASGQADRPVRLFLDEEDKTEEALKTFVPLKECKYDNKYLGASKVNDFMECDCYEEFSDGVNHACDENSDCINRLTMIECVNGLCDSCGENCQNQRFQKHQYAEIAVFKTEKKGYGVRAEKNIEANALIHEYIGEVITEDEFRDRLIKYDQCGFKHFYFMMLQAGEFIDATIKGSLARFCNHSCNPNAYVSKWLVAGKLKMGIFANRTILKGEEITFDYNVDRYGATAQKCYCEEPNCIGFLGGKTQTDAASLLPQNYADALDVSPSMEKKWMKEKKAKGETIAKSKEDNINIEFVESLEVEPCETVEDITRVMSVLLRLDNKLIGLKLFQRLFNVKEEELLHQVIKLHGYKCFVNLLRLFSDQVETVKDIFQFLLALPKTTKNGITASHIDDEVNKLIKDQPALKENGEKLLSKWASFETYNRISKKDINAISTKMIDLRRIKLPPGWEIVHENGTPMYYNAQLQTKLRQPPTGTSKTFSSSQPGTPSNGDIAGRLHSSSSATGLNVGPSYLNKKKRPRMDDKEYEKFKEKRLQKELEAIERVKDKETQELKAKLELENRKRTELANIIAEANKQKEREREEQERLEKEKAEKRLQSKMKSHTNHLEHKWTKFFASFVPNLLRKYEADSHLSRDTLKHCARDIVKILSEKEAKKHPNITPPEEPSKEKRSKVKAFVKVYMEKFLVKYDKKKHPSTK